MKLTTTAKAFVLLYRRVYTLELPYPLAYVGKENSIYEKLY